jgi:hypothetical protein
MGSKITLEDIGGESCEPVSGLAIDVYYALHSDYASIEDPKDLCGLLGAQNFAELVEISAAPGHIFKPTKHLFKMETITESGSLKTKMIGDKGRHLFENSLEIELSGSSASLLGFLRWIKNQRFVFMCEEFGTGQIRQLGSKRMGAIVEGIDTAIEATVEGKNAVKLILKDKQKWPAAIYKGNLQLTPVPVPVP